MNEIKFRCSSLGKLMTSPRSKSETISETAKSYIKSLVKEEYFGYKSQISSKEIEKGHQVEIENMEMYNQVFMTDFEKNRERRTNDYLSGEPDAIDGDVILDIKSPWSLETFPLTSEDADSKAYEWQMRGYMMLFDKPKAIIAYCMATTPEHLISPWDNADIHIVDHIDAKKRITTVEVLRDASIEDEMIARLKECQKFYNEYRTKVFNK